IVLITAVNTLNVFALVQSMTEGGPFFASDVVETYIFRTAFGTSQSAAPPRLGYASAAGVFFGITVFALVLLQIVAARRANAMRRELTSNRGQA
ncbi:MAG: carbohydrate ABC transporter permease, partial [Thermomicrobiales bacterium]